MSKETQETKKEAAVKTTKTTQVPQGPVVYVGHEIIKEKPAIKKLFVKVSEVADAKKQLSQENSALSIIYRKVAEEQ